MKEIDFLKMREALEASWDEKTSYMGAKKTGNPAPGQCYPTSWVVQHFFPEMEIVRGFVWNGKGIEKHYWNVLETKDGLIHIDLTWQQFPHGSCVRGFETLDRNELNDTEPTIKRCETLLERVTRYLEKAND